MIDNKYIGELDNQDIRWYNYLVRDKGGIINALEFILKGLDCSRIYQDGNRPVQTINYGYRTDIGGFIYLNNKLIEECPNCKVNYYDKLIKLHEQNIDFEKTNPPIYYKSKQRTSSRNTRRVAEISDIFTGEKSTVDVGSGKIIRPKDNAAVRKAKALNNKTVNFAFNNFKVNK